MPKKEIVKVNAAAANPNLSLATKFGGLVFVAGQTGRHPVTGELGKDVREQTRNVLERIKTILGAAGTSLDNVLTATTHLTNVANLAAYNEEYAKYFPTSKPARTTVTVAALNAPELLIEITVTAGIPSWAPRRGHHDAFREEDRLRPGCLAHRDHRPLQGGVRRRAGQARPRRRRRRILLGAGESRDPAHG